MTIRWEKLGLIFRPDKNKSWMKSHASLPTPLHLNDSLFRIYFSSRDSDNRSHVGYFDLDLDSPRKIQRVADNPILSPGPLGNFDDHGIYAASAVRHNDKIFLYTIGWNPGKTHPLFYSSIGLAISEDGGTTFQKYGASPIMSRSQHDPCLVTSPVVIKDGSKWRMWYVSGYRWDQTGEAMQSVYHVKYAESRDGITWKRNGTICIDHANPQEKNIARCCVIKFKKKFNAWFSSNSGSGYRIGSAFSTNGLIWKRDGDVVGLEPSLNGWDSEAMAYPFVIRHGNRQFMFYNGNAFGKDGIGLAVREA